MIDLLTLLQVVNQVDNVDLTISKVGGNTEFTCILKDSLELPSFDEEAEEDEIESVETYLDGSSIDPPNAPQNMTY